MAFSVDHFEAMGYVPDAACNARQDSQQGARLLMTTRLVIKGPRTGMECETRLRKNT